MSARRYCAGGGKSCPEEDGKRGKIPLQSAPQPKDCALTRIPPPVPQPAPPNCRVFIGNLATEKTSPVIHGPSPPTHKSSPSLSHQLDPFLMPNSPDDTPCISSPVIIPIRPRLLPSSRDMGACTKSHCSAGCSHSTAPLPPPPSPLTPFLDVCPAHSIL